MLTLKDKLQLFKLAKKPRKEIRLRLQVITNSLNLPSLHKTYKQLQESSSEKNQKAIANINNFKKIDKTKHNITTVCKTEENQLNETSSKENYKKKQRKTNDSRYYRTSKWMDQKDCSTRLSSTSKNTEFLMSDFNFNMTREQKMQKRAEEETRKSRQDFTYLQKTPKQESQGLIKLKNQFSGLKNMNKLYKAQLQNAKRIEKISFHANRMSQVFLKTEDIRDSFQQIGKM